MAPVALDAFDRRILAALSRNARLSNLELEKEVKLSHSAISRRIKRLESSGVIEGYVARINKELLGQSVHAFVSVTRATSTSALDLGNQLSEIEGVAASYIVTGEQDVFIEVYARDLSDFAEMMLGKVQAVPGVATTRTLFAVRQLGLPPTVPAPSET
jgi:Lrp/AsnC family leucine-responsive transcriptional regulator